MAKKYSDNLVKKIQEKQYTETINDVKVLVKPIPDCDIPGAMDPRLYEASKKMALIMKFVPKRFMKMDTSPKGIVKLRKMFNSVDSTPMVDMAIDIHTATVTARDGYEIPIKIYNRKTDSKNKPVLYFIHGGGFFGGHSGVVEEAMKLIVQNEDIVVFSIDYRLAPENPYPTGHNDTFSGLQWVEAHAAEYDGNPKAIFIAGDSAGGNLTQFCTNRALEENMTCVKGQMLLYPTVNMGGVDDPYVRFDINKYEIYEKHASAINIMLGMMGDSGDMLSDILGTTDIMTPYLTPYMSVRSDLPPSFVTVGEHDFLTIETLAYARKLVKAGVDTTTVLYKGMGHAYIDQIGNYPQAEDLILEMGKFIRKYV